MEFKKADRYHQVSGSGLYTVSALRVRGTTWMFQAWRRGDPPKKLGPIQDEAEKARELCRQDAEEATA